MTAETIPEVLRRRFGPRVRAQEPLAAHTSFQIGGPADLLVIARSRADLVDAIGLAAALGLPWLVLGRGSNALILDAGIRGLVIRNDASDFTIERTTGRVHCDSGARMPSVGAQTARAGLTGLEWLVGIPGSVGGGVVMNAGAHGSAIADVLVCAEVLVGGDRVEWPAAAFAHSYRSSRLQRERGVVVLGADFQLAPAPAPEALARIHAYRQHRQASQPTDPGAGSIFRNPPGAAAGALIDRAGLKGRQSGGALISPKHGNFIVNVGDASAADVLALIGQAQAAVEKQFGVRLEPEVELIGPLGRLSLEAATAGGSWG
jgi:UDP-N-acetylmuramate dehydrogenase